MGSRAAYDGERTLGQILTAAALGATALGGGVAGLAAGGGSSAEAAGRAGAAQIVDPSGRGPLSSGGSRTAFTIKLPAGAACKGDSARANYRIQSYLVPQDVDLGTLAFAPGVGPEPVPGQFRAPMYEASAGASSYVDQLTAEAVPVGGPGVIIQPLPAFSFAVFDPAFGFPFTPGIYNVGIACTMGPPSAQQQEKHWNTLMTITADPNDSGPAKTRWTVAAAAVNATTTRSPLVWLAVAGAGALLSVGGAFVLRSRRRGVPLVTQPSPSHTLKETR